MPILQLGGGQKDGIMKLGIDLEKLKNTQDR